MRFIQLTAREYASFANSRQRLFIPQLPEFARVRANEGYDVEYVGVVDDNGADKEATASPDNGATSAKVILGAGVIVYQPWKKYFRRAQLTYGPTLDWENAELVSTFFTGLRTYLASRPRVLSLRFNPLVHKAFYHDIEKIKPNPIAEQVEQQFADLGMIHIDKEFYQQPDVQIRFIYTKDIANMTFEEATATLAKGLRRRFHNEGRYGVDVRFLSTDEFDVFDALHESTAQRTSMHTMTNHSENLYRDLMMEMGPERAILCVAYVSPSKYQQEIDEERATIKEKLQVLHDRPQTKARDREISQSQQRLKLLAEQRIKAQRTLDLHGDNIPFNAALSFRVKDELILLLGGMDKRFASYGRDYPVERAMFKWACDHNLKIYNTFGISGIFDDSAPDAPVLKFKRWLCGNVEEFIGTYMWPIRPHLAKLLGALN